MTGIERPSNLYFSNRRRSIERPWLYGEVLSIQTTCQSLILYVAMRISAELVAMAPERCSISSFGIPTLRITDL